MSTEGAMKDDLPPLPETFGRALAAFATACAFRGYAERMGAADAVDAEVRAYASQAVAAAVAAERERCARVCESTYPEWDVDERAMAQRPCFDTPAECAAAIRQG